MSTTSSAGGPPRRLRRALLGTLVVLGLVAVLVVGVPRPQIGTLPAVEYEAQLTAARRDGPYPLLVPDPLPQGWAVTGVRYDGDVEGAATWHVGLLTPAGRVAGVEQSNGDSAPFVIAQTRRGLPRGRRTIDGVTWQKRYRDVRDVHSLVRVADGVTTVVTGTATFAELAELAGSLR